jgi:transcriptional regulator with XRE-family HTH domain
MSSNKFANLRDKVIFIFKESKCSQAEIARKLGISEAYVSEIVKGKKKINLSDTLVKLICHEFSVNHEWMFNDIGEIYLPKVNMVHDMANIDLGEIREPKLKKIIKQHESRIALLERILTESRPDPGRRFYDPLVAEKK